MSWDGRSETGRHELLDLMVTIGLERLEESEGVAEADQVRAAIDAGQYRGFVDRGVAFLRVGCGDAERPFFAITVAEIEEALERLDPDTPEVPN